MKHTTTSRRLILAVTFLLLFTLVACDLTTQVGEVQTSSETVELGAASRARVDVTMGAGELNMTGGATELLEANFTFNIADWQPEVSYAVSGETGRLTVQQPDMEGLNIPTGDIRYEWDLSLRDDVPMDMNVTLGAGTSDLLLEELALEDLEIQTGAGDVNVSVGSTLADMQLTVGAGDVNVDFVSDWQNDLDASVRAGVGRLTLRLPDNVGVRVLVNRGLGDVNANNFRVNGDEYTNDAFGDAETTLFIEVDGGVGEINLELAE